MKIKFSFFVVLFVVASLFSQEAYYNGVNLNVTGLTLKNELAIKIISTHTRTLFYEQIWDASKATDVNPNNPSQVLLIYGWENGSDADVTNDRERGIQNNSGTPGDWNREHVYSQSLGTPPLSDSGPGSDAHHLRPSDTQRNSSRNNRKFTSGSGNSGIQSNGGWYPGDEWKGDVARMMMYMYLRYNDRCLPTNIGIGSSATTPDDMIDLFLQWNADDPVSDFERQRNTYHENTSNQNAQGNRNPFIDNPRLATRIWGGPEAEDSWGIYTNADTEVPTTPTNLTATNITTFSVDLSWTAATDNIGVTSYDIYMNGNLEIATSNTSVNITNLIPNSNYSFAVLAKDIANNASQLSIPLEIQTLQDTEAPTAPDNVVISNETSSTFIVSWDASVDNTKVVLYEIMVNDLLHGTSTNEMYTVTGLSTSTTYQVQIIAVDESTNKSNPSNIVNATTTDGSTTTSNELFFSEYVEGSSNNKALEIVNLTSSDIDMTSYSIQRQTNGGLNGSVWEFNLPLTGTITSGDVYVIINSAASLQKLIDEADFIQPHNGDTNFGAPINFNGNDPVGLFKNGILIDIIGTYNGGSANFAINKTLRRKSDISQPNTNFDSTNEWDVYPEDSVEDIGQHNTTLSIYNNLFKGLAVYPNPVSNSLMIQNKEQIQIQKVIIYNLIGTEMLKRVLPSNKIAVENLPKGIYFIQLQTDKGNYTSKFIKQ